MASVESAALVSSSPVRNPTYVAFAQGNRSRQVVEFKDKYGTFSFYFRKWQIEINPNFDLKHFRDTDDEEEEEEDENHVDDPREALITYIQQVRQSFGFDVDVVVPSWATVDYFPIDLSNPISHDDMIEGAQIAIDGINYDMKSKSYELVGVVKAVYCRNLSKYLTITAKKLDEGPEAQPVTIQAIVKDYPGMRSELEQWRFKP